MKKRFCYLKSKWLAGGYFLKPILILFFFIAILGINLWQLNGNDFYQPLFDGKSVNYFCYCLKNNGGCRRFSKQNSKKELRRREDLVEKNPAYPDGWAKLATIWLYEGRYDLAEMTIKRAVDLAPFRDDLKKLEKRIGDACN